MIDIKKGISYFNTLSLDVVTGAVLSALFAAKVLDVDMEKAFWLVLPLSVWVVYTADHLVDAWRLKHQAHTLRHRFHFRFFKQLSILVLLFGAADVLIAFYFLRPQIIELGIFVGLFVMGYLLLLHYFGERGKTFLQKELIVALVYVTGVWGGPLVHAGYSISNSQLLLLSCFLLLALADVLLFTIYDAKTDKIDHHQTLSSRYGINIPLHFFYMLIYLVLMICIYMVIFQLKPHYIIAALIYGAMAISLALLVYYRDYFSKNKSYRYLGELVFWLPGLILLFYP